MESALVVVSMNETFTSGGVDLANGKDQTVLVMWGTQQFSAKSLELVSGSELFQSLVTENPGPTQPVG